MLAVYPTSVFYFINIFNFLQMFVLFSNSNNTTFLFKCGINLCDLQIHSFNSFIYLGYAEGALPLRPASINSSVTPTSLTRSS